MPRAGPRQAVSRAADLTCISLPSSGPPLCMPRPLWALSWRLRAPPSAHPAFHLRAARLGNGWLRGAGAGAHSARGGGWPARSVTQPVGGGGVQVATTPVSLELVSSLDVSWNVLQAYKRIKVYFFFLSHPRTQVPQLEERTCSVTGPSEVAGREC